MQRNPPSRILERARSTFGAGPRVWSLILTVVGVASVVAAASWNLTPGDNPLRYLPWILLVAFLLVESYPVHLQYRSETASFSMLEIPLVIGLFLSSGASLILAHVVGSVIALSVIRRQPLVKLVFNAANLALQSSLAVLIFDALGGGSDPLDPTVALSALVATMTSSTLNATILGGIIHVAEGHLTRKKVTGTLVVATIVAIANTSLGLIAVVLIQGAGWSLTLLAIPLVVLAVSYRAFVSERTQREQVEFLYTATKSLQTSDAGQVGTETLVSEAAEMFRASRVQMVLFNGEDGSTGATSYSLDRLDSEVRFEQYDELDEALEVARQLENATMMTTSDIGPARDLLDSWGIGDGMIAALAVDDKMIGLLSVADRLGTVGSFGPEDLRLFETLAYHASTALENDRLGQALSRLRSLERELSHLATHDALTGLPNRLQLRQYLDRIAGEGDSAVELMFIDLDDFKFVNDTFGHAVGDELLREVGRRIGRCLGPTDIAARLGGDEFAIVVQPAQRADEIADRLIRTVAAPMVLEGNSIAVGCSIGIAGSDNMAAGSHLLRHADVAMYAAKKGGKGRVARYSSELGEVLATEQKLQQRLRSAIAADELRVHYQPIYQLETGRIAGAEALLRWQNPEGLSIAETFLPVAESSGLIVQIDRWVFTSVVADLAYVNDPTIWHAVNLSARSLHEDDIVEFILSTTAASSVDPSRIVLEVTETAAMRDIEAAISKLDRLVEAGFVIALDDFGTGYSSISHLRRLPVQLLKIAQPFVADLGGPSGRAFVEAMINLGHTLGLKIVGEGIEHDAQREELCELQCDFGQGFLLDQPMDKLEYRQLLTAMSQATTSAN